MNPRKTNELKSGTKIILNNGDYCELKDNKRGNIRMALCPNFFNKELILGSIYSHNIAFAIIDGKIIPIEHTKAQLKCKALNDTLFG